MACSKPSSATSTGSSSNTTFGPFWEKFILVYIPSLSCIAQRRLIKLKVDRKGRFILHFQDIDEVSLVYCAFKEEDGKTLSRELKKRRDNFLAITKQEGKRGLLKNVGHGTEDNKEYHKFEVLNTALWQSLESKFSVQKHSQWTYRSAAAFGGGMSSDTGLGNSQSNEQQSNEAPSSSGENSGVIPLDTQPDDEANAMITENEDHIGANDDGVSLHLSGLAEDLARQLSDIDLSSTNAVTEQPDFDPQQRCDHLTARDSVVSPTHFQERGSSASHTDHSLGTGFSTDEVNFNDSQSGATLSDVPMDEYMSSQPSLSTPEWSFGQDEDSGTAQLYDSSYETSGMFRENHDVIQSETSSDAQAFLSSDDNVVNKTHGRSGSETTPESGIGDIQADQPMSNETSETFGESQDVIQNKTSSHSKELNSLEVMRIFPNICDIKGGCLFIIAAGNQSLPPVKYHIEFKDYGTCEASGTGTQYLEGKEAIPAAKRRGTHSIEVKVFTTNRILIGVIPFTYVDTAGDVCVQQVVEEESISSNSLDPRNRPTKRPSNECEENASKNKRMKSYPIDMSMLMYLCDEMAKRGDEDFFRALIKLGILADVLANRSKYFNSFALTAQEHGYGELAELIVRSSRNTLCDCLMENLTLEKLVDAVQRERSLVKSIDSSDDDSDSCLSGYNGDYDSEDDKLSSNTDSDDDDSRSGNITQTEAKEKDVTKRVPSCLQIQTLLFLNNFFGLNEEKGSVNCVITEQREQFQDLADDDIPELEPFSDLNEEKESTNDDIIKQGKQGEEAKAKDKDVTKRVPSDKNVSMICAQVESSGVETSSSINVKTGLDNMDTQAVKTAVVETTSVPSSVEHSANLSIGHVCDLPETGAPKFADVQTLYKTDNVLVIVSSDDDESRGFTIAQELFRGISEYIELSGSGGSNSKDEDIDDEGWPDPLGFRQIRERIRRMRESYTMYKVILWESVRWELEEERKRQLQIDLNEKKGSANCVITGQEQQIAVNQKENLVDDDIIQLKSFSGGFGSILDALHWKRRYVVHGPKLRMLQSAADNQLRRIDGYVTFQQDAFMVRRPTSDGTCVYVGLQVFGDREVAVKCMLTDSCEHLVKNEIKILGMLKMEKSAHVVRYLHYQRGNPFLELCQFSCKEYVNRTHEFPGRILYNIIEMSHIGPHELLYNEILHRDLLLPGLQLFNFHRANFGGLKIIDFREEFLRKEILREQEETKRKLQREKKRKRKLEKKRKLKLAIFGKFNANVLGRFKSRGGRWKVISNSPKSGCGKTMVDFSRKRKMTASNSSLSDLNFKDATIMKQSLGSKRNMISRKKRHGFHNLTNPLTMRIEDFLHELAVIGGVDECSVNEKCDMVKMITRIPPINVLGTSLLVRFSEKQLFAENGTGSQTTRLAMEFGNTISDVGLENRLSKNLSSSVADVHFTLEAKPFRNEKGPGDEVQSTGAKGVTWITLDLARIGDEVVATKVEFVYEAISENDSENTERTDITATASTKNELDDGADLN